MRSWALPDGQEKHSKCRSQAGYLSLVKCNTKVYSNCKKSVSKRKLKFRAFANKEEVFGSSKCMTREQIVHYYIFSADIDATGRLIKNQHFWPSHQSLGNRYFLLITAG